MNIFDFALKTSIDEECLKLILELNLIPEFSMLYNFCRYNCSFVNQKQSHTIDSVKRCNNKTCIK